MRKVRKYTAEFKTDAVNLALKSPNISKTAEELGIPVASLHSWIQQLKGKSTPPGAGNPGERDMASLIEENRRLHKELGVAKEERDILKKAAAYFAQHQK